MNINKGNERIFYIDNNKNIITKLENNTYMYIELSKFTLDDCTNLLNALDGIEKLNKKFYKNITEEEFKNIELYTVDNEVEEFSENDLRGMLIMHRYLNYDEE